MKLVLVLSFSPKKIIEELVLFQLRSPAFGGANSPAAWSECPLPTEASPPRSLSLDPPVLQRLVRLELQRSPSQSNIDPNLLQEMVENVITQLPMAQARHFLKSTFDYMYTEPYEGRHLDEQFREKIVH